MGFDFSLFGQFTGLDLGIEGQLILLLIIGVCAAAITQNTKQIRMLLFPLAFGFRSIGLEINVLIMVGLGILWGVTIIGTHEIGNAITSIPGTIKERIYTERKANRAKLTADFKTSGISAFKFGADPLNIKQLTGKQAYTTRIDQVGKQRSKADALIRNTTTKSNTTFKQDMTNSVAGYNRIGIYGPEVEALAYERAKKIQDAYTEHGINIRESNRILQGKILKPRQKLKRTQAGEEDEYFPVFK